MVHGWLKIYTQGKNSHGSLSNLICNQLTRKLKKQVFEIEKLFFMLRNIETNFLHFNIISGATVLIAYLLHERQKDQRLHLVFNPADLQKS